MNKVQILNQIKMAKLSYAADKLTVVPTGHFVGV
jgi:hypothetical protein